MTINELYAKLRASKEEIISSQLLSDGLSANLSSFFTKLIKDAARCNNYSSDIFYSLNTIYDAMKAFRPRQEFTPIFVGFRRHGVDGNSFILSRLENDLRGNVYSLGREYFALYSINVEKSDGEGWYNVIIREYWM